MRTEVGPIDEPNRRRSTAVRCAHNEAGNNLDVGHAGRRHQVVVVWVDSLCHPATGTPSDRCAHGSRETMSVAYEDLEFGAMSRDEVSVLVDWAAAEGWNPGRCDVEVAWAVDPAAFIAVRHRDELIAGGTIVSYESKFGFMGLFIVRSDLRSQGLGTRLWYFRRDRLLARLRPGATIGMDGVFDMVPFYERGGFALSHRDLRFQGIAHGRRHDDVIELSLAGPDAIDQYDRRHFPTPRTEFLRRWITQPGTLGAAVVERGELVAYGLVRPCRVGYKFGPLFADRVDLAELLISHLCAGIEGEQVQLDVPEPNTAGLQLAAARGWSESFGCARMYLGTDPQLPLDRIFGVTSFEFG